MKERIDFSDIELALFQAMRERSHKKGERYQQKVRAWLVNHPYMGYDTQKLGDAYDITCKATRIGNKMFDFSLSLHECKDNDAIKILYVECKYRSDVSSSISSDFDRFLQDVYYAIRDADDEDDRKCAEFCFVSTIPPSQWGKFIKNRFEYYQSLLSKNVETLNENIIRHIIPRIDILILSEKILGD